MTNSLKKYCEGKMKRTLNKGVKKNIKMNQKKQLGKKQRTFCIMDQQVNLISVLILS